MIWFERAIGDDNYWHSDVIVSEVKNDTLLVSQLHGQLPKLGTRTTPTTTQNRLTQLSPFPLLESMVELAGIEPATSSLRILNPARQDSALKKSE